MVSSNGLSGEAAVTHAKLNADQVRWIRREVMGEKRSQTDVAREYGVTRSTINDILRGKTWKWVE